MTIKSKKYDLATGRLLIAEPFMLDPHFKRSVVLICDYHSEGTFGLILNKSLKINITELVHDFPNFESVVYYGGPVHKQSITFLHNVGHLLKDSVQVSKGIYLGGNYEQLKFLIETKMILPHNIRFFLGCSGWGAGQLIDEMELSSWMIGKVDPNYVFNGKGGLQLWQQVLKHKGDRYSIIAEIPEKVCWS